MHPASWSVCAQYFSKSYEVFRKLRFKEHLITFWGWSGSPSRSKNCFKCCLCRRCYCMSDPRVLVEGCTQKLQKPRRSHKEAWGNKHPCSWRAGEQDEYRDQGWWVIETPELIAEWWWAGQAEGRCWTEGHKRTLVISLIQIIKFLRILYH